MTWREKTLIAILLLVARIVAPEHRDDIQRLATHISVNAPRDEGREGQTR